MTKLQISLALLSGSGILLEIALTRLFSTLFFPPYVFAIISVAVLGIGLGAALATARPVWRRPSRIPFYLAATGYSALILVLTVVWTTSIDWAGALYTETDGRAEPHKAAPAIARAAAHEGATVLRSCAVRGVETSGGRVSAGRPAARSRCASRVPAQSR